MNMAAIEALNRLVLQKVARLTEDGKGDHVEVIAVATEGKQVYHHRWRLGVYLTTLFALVSLTLAPSWSALLVWAAVMYLYVDLYGGILHYNLDNPEFIKVPLIDAGCLEFQWHHHNPHDIASKEFVEVLGDLNWTVFIHLSFIFLLCKGALGMSFDLRVALMLTGLKCLFAYFGQYAHRMAHTSHNPRPAWVRQLQAAGLMLPPGVHSSHHRTYDHSLWLDQQLSVEIY